MGKWFVFLILTFLCVFSANVYATGVMPVVGPGPDGSMAVKLEVTSSESDQSWMWIDLGGITPDEHPVVTVSFDIYRYSSGEAPHEWLTFGWWDFYTDEMDNVDPNQGWMGQIDAASAFTVYPYVGHGTSGTTPALTDQYATLELAWDFENSICTSFYNGEQVDFSYENIFSEESILNGFFIALFGNGTDGEVAWIDNLVIEGSPLYDSNGFNSFITGELNGQYGWIAGNETTSPPVPEPSTMVLLGSGLLGIVGFHRRWRKELKLKK